MIVEFETKTTPKLKKITGKLNENKDKK